MGQVQSGGVPPKVTTQYLESIGLKSKNDRAMIGVLKALQFLDASGLPTANWKKYRSKQDAGKVMAAAVRTAYASLFDLYPDAQRKDNEALRNFFSSRTSVGEGALAQMVRTFKALCDLSDFDSMGVASANAARPDDVADEAVVARPVNLAATNSNGMTVNINIQLSIPATDDASVYDRFFAAMKKHLG